MVGKTKSHPSVAGWLIPSTVPTKDYGRGESGIFATPLFGRGESGMFATPLFGRGESGMLATPLFGRGESGMLATPLLPATFEIAMFVAATIANVTTSDRKRLAVVDIRNSPLVMVVNLVIGEMKMDH